MLQELFIDTYDDGERGPLVIIGSHATGSTVMEVFGEDEADSRFKALDVLTAFAVVEWLEDQLLHYPDRLAAVADAMKSGATMIDAIRQNN